MSTIDLENNVLQELKDHIEKRNEIKYSVLNGILINFIRDIGHEKIYEVYNNIITQGADLSLLDDSTWYTNINELKDLGYIILSCTKTSVRMKHLECGREYTRSYGYLKIPDSHICPNCNRTRKKITKEQVAERVRILLGPEYMYDSNFSNANRTFRVKHIKCDRVYQTRMSTIINGFGSCPKCR